MSRKIAIRIKMNDENTDNTQDYTKEHKQIKSIYMGIVTIIIQ